MLNKGCRRRHDRSTRVKSGNPIWVHLSMIMMIGRRNRWIVTGVMVLRVMHRRVRVRVWCCSGVYKLMGRDFGLRCHRWRWRRVTPSWTMPATVVTAVAWDVAHDNFDSPRTGGGFGFLGLWKIERWKERNEWTTFWSERKGRYQSYELLIN